jgi:hypothetical protein
VIAQITDEHVSPKSSGRRVDDGGYRFMKYSKNLTSLK